MAGAATSGAVSKWGNSSALRIPKSVMNQAGLQEGDKVGFEVEGPGVIVVRASNTEPTLKTLVSRITRSNRHQEADWERSRGSEAW